MSQIDWTDINSKLPFGREPEETERRKEIWTSIDVNGNGFVSLSEVTTVSCPAEALLSNEFDPFEGSPRCAEAARGL